MKNSIALIGIFSMLLAAGAVYAKVSFQNVDVHRAAELAQSKKVVILDVRTPAEFNQGHLKGARLIPVQDLEDRLDELAHLKDRPILVYCRSGRRSVLASKILSRDGFTRIFNMKGGVRAWLKASQPLLLPGEQGEPEAVEDDDVDYESPEFC